MGKPTCDVPTCGLTWQSLVPPVVLGRWPPHIDDRLRRFRTISQWVGKGSFHLNGRYSGEKSDSWRAVADLPRKTSQELEIALRVDPAYQADLSLFAEGGWILTPPTALRDLHDYSNYIVGSSSPW